MTGLDDYRGGTEASSNGHSTRLGVNDHPAGTGIMIPLNGAAFALIPATNGLSMWADSSWIPANCAALSALHLLVPVIVRRAFHKEPEFGATCSVDLSELDIAELSYIQKRIRTLGSLTIFCLRMIQSLAILALLLLSFGQLSGVGHLGSRQAVANAPRGTGIQCVVYGYTWILSVFALFGNTRLNRVAFIHTSLLLAITWTVYMYRDVWPLATSDLSPADAAEGAILWAKLCLLSLSGIFIPLFIPRKYIPINPKEPNQPSPEQTASLFSLLFYTYLESFIWRARRLSHVHLDMLPLLRDYDHLKNLVGRAFPILDPMQTKSQRHLGLLLIRTFWFELCNLAAMSITAVIGAFAAPISINQLLQYLESGRTETPIKPWFWIAFLGFGRLFKDVSDQWFMYYTTRLSVRTQAILTELVFEHALRIRMKAGTPDNTSQLQVEVTREAESEEVSPYTTASSDTPTPDPGKGKAKSASNEGTSPKKVDVTQLDEAKKTPHRHLVGRINNLVTSDLGNLEGVGTWATFISVESPFQIMLCIIFLYQILGWSALVGLVTMLITLPLPGWITKQIQGAHREKMRRTDSRVQTVNETLNVIRMIKLFGWEPRIAAQLDKKREEELVSVRRSQLLAMFINSCNNMLPILIMLSTFFTYTVIMKEELTASRVFSSMAVFDMLRIDLQASFSMIPKLVHAKVSLERISDFLRNTELIDEFEHARASDNTQTALNAIPEDRKGVIGIRHATFTWSKDGAPSRTLGGTRMRSFVLAIDEELIFRRGRINLIIGPTGAGKISLLMALLGEMHYKPAGPDSYVSLPRDGGIAYAAQESWVQNDTIKNNILFGSLFDEVRYNKVLYQCALKRDLSLFNAGDETEVGEKGITLSGGQKARITLARAVYSHAEVLLLDDVLAALDVHTSRWIVEKCLKGDLLQGRTILLVTHNVAMASPIADFVVYMGSDGRILSQGSLERALARDSKLVNEVQGKREELEKSELEIDAEKPDDAVPTQAAGKLMVAEEREEGHVGWSALKLFLGNMSNRPILFWLIYVSGHVLRQSLANLQTWYLGYWASQYETHSPKEVPAQHYLSIYTLLMALDMGAFACSVSYYVFGSLRAARVIHKQLVTSVVGTTLR
ncbi:hypothetical protein ACG7TL_001814 [Trametes sanguinea]